jgi:PhoPQ-activated pathogenicity-related protein
MKKYGRISGTFTWIGALGIVFLGFTSNQLNAQTTLDQYVHAPDDSYSWRIVSSQESRGMKTMVVDMISQNWRTSEDVDRTQWQHWVTVSIPNQVRSPIGLLFIGGGRNAGDPPEGPNEMLQSIARATGTMVAELRMVPNQPLTFHQDGQGRIEDDLIGYTWDQFLQTGDPTWPARNPMVKSAVRAMDTMTAVAASDAGGGQTVERFVVTGGSKRGWTTWLTGAVDQRVVGIVPIVIDVLNIDPSMRHHFAAYGFWAPAIGDYVQHRIMERMGHPRLKELYDLVDPHQYRDRLTMPKFIVNATGDQFFLPDSSQFYWDDLLQPKYLRYVPNADHGLRDSDAVESLTAFYSLILEDKQGPQFSWSRPEPGTLQVQPKDQPREVRLWQATNPAARDFRVETLGRKFTSTVLQPQADGQYVATLSPPEEGWTAFFVELTYDVGGIFPLKLTTGVAVIPDVLPYADRDPSQPATLTVVFTATDPQMAERTLSEAAEWITEQGFADGQVRSEQRESTGYVNWQPAGRWAEVGRAFTEWLRAQGVGSIQYQLESGPKITTR